MRTRREIQRSLVIALGAGVLLSCVMAWAAAWAREPNTQRRTTFISSQPPVIVHPRTHPDYVSMAGWMVTESENVGIRRLNALHSFHWLRQDESTRLTSLRDGLPNWSSLHHLIDLTRPPKPHTSERPMNIQLGAGWPMICLTCDEFPWRAWMVSVPRLDLRTFEVLSPRVIPLRPWWPGLLANTLFYGAIVWIVRYLPRLLRVTRRRRRGLCATCGYAMRGSGRDGADLTVCPECGTPGV